MNDTQPVCTVVSLFPFDIFEEKPGLIPGRFRIEASDTKEPQVIKVTKCIHFVYLDSERGSLQVRDAPDEVARAIVEDFCSAQLGIREGVQPGLFWVTGDYSPAQIKEKFKIELVRAQLSQIQWFTSICRIADDDWNKYHKHTVVSDFQRKAAHLIGWKPEEHPWMNARVTENSVHCPSCTAVLDEKVIVCPNCSCILKPEEYKKLEFANVVKK